MTGGGDKNKVVLMVSCDRLASVGLRCGIIKGNVCIIYRLRSVRVVVVLEMA